MKKIFIALTLMLATAAAYAQNAIVDIEEQEAMGRTEATLGKKAVAVFLSASDNLVISSSNTTDAIGTTQKMSGGLFGTEVTCDLSDNSIERSRTFSVLIKGTSLKGTIKKTLTPGRRIYFHVTEAEHMLTSWWPETKDILYPVAGKSCIEFNVPQSLNDLKVNFSDGIGGKVSRRSDKGMNIVALEVDSKLVATRLNDIKLKKAQAAEAERQYYSLKQDNDAKCNEEGFDFDAAEAKEKALEEAWERAVDAIPTLFVTLYGEKSNQLPVPEDKLELLAEAKYKLTIGVNDALQKTIVGTTALAEKLKSANMAYQGRRFREAATFYQQASEDPDATEADKAACTGWIETINKCISAQTEANKALLLLKNYKEKGGEVNPDNVVDLYNIAINNYQTLYTITRNEFYQTRIENYEKSRDKVGYVMSGTVISTNFKQGILYEEPITGISIYGTYGTFNKDMKKGAHGVFVGKVDADGKFHVEVPRGEYEGLLFVPTTNKKFSKNVWQSLKGSKHLDIKVRFTRDH